MPVGEVLETLFINYVSGSLIIIIGENGESISTFKKNLRKISYRVRGESRLDFKDLFKDNPALIRTLFDDMIKKVERLEKDLFKVKEDGIYYINNQANLKIEENGSLFRQFAYYIHEYCQEIKGIFQSRLQELNDLTKLTLANNIQSPKNIIKKKRSPKRQSFELYNRNVNLQLVHKILREGEFIDIGTSFDNFSQIFSGDPVSPKIVWNNANSLQYFIQEIIGGGGVKSPNEGKWNRTIKCFKKPDGEYQVKDLKDTKAPVGSKTNYLDLAIEEINKK